DAAQGWAGGLVTPSDMRAEPWVAVPAMARAAARVGVTVVEGCAVRLIDVAAGRVAGVVSERGRIAAPAVVVAGGAWSSLLLRRAGVDIPQLAVRATVAATGPMAEVTAGAAADSRIAFRRRQDGGYTLAPGGFHELMLGPDTLRHFNSFIKKFLRQPLGTRLLPKAPGCYPDGWGTPRRWQGDEISPFERMRVLNPAPHQKTLRRLTKDFARMFPAAGRVELHSAWAGMIDVLPDIVPVVDRVAALPGLVVATGMCGHGFGIGPAFGRITATLVTGGAPGHDITRFRMARFSDGTKLTPGPAL
ncbi:MAG TPA: FAD-binding oxidoreductase, partial [Paracoccaceae bacterium]|nr:FAD-binding oxidoreductase [Paracoccaceae bacterium]